MRQYTPLLPCFALLQLATVALSLATPKTVRRVAVIGSGISGLSVAHTLTNSPGLKEKYQPSEEFQVSVFDSRPKIDRNVGAGIQLSGGLAVLGMINQEVQAAVTKAGLPTYGIRSRCKPWNSDKDFDTLLEINLREAVVRAGGNITEALLKDDELQWTSIMRSALQEVLYDTLPTNIQKQTAFGKSLTSIEPLGNGEAQCVFSDGSTEGPFDLIVGCDGIKSPCKEFVETGSISSDAQKREGDSVALYSGLRIRYAIDKALQVPEQPKLTQYFGNGGYGLHSVYGTGRANELSECAFLVYQDENYIGPFKKQQPSSQSKVRENADWSQDEKDRSGNAKETMLNELDSFEVPGCEIEPVIARSDKFLELGVYFHNPFSLNGWSREVEGSDGAHVVLVGDAAHALPPFLGQGSNQAIQDAYCLGTRLYEFNHLQKTETNISVGQFLKDYESVRWPSCFAIFWKAAFLGYLEVGGFRGFVSKFRDVFFKTMGLLGVAEKILLGSAVPRV